MPYDLILKNISRHISLDKEEEDYFVSLLDVKKIKKKQILLSEGEFNKHINFVTKGCLRLFCNREDSSEHIIQFAIEDWWISDPHSFFSAEKSIFSIDALEDSEMLRLSRENLNALYKTIPKFERFFRILCERTLVAYQKRVATNISVTAKERYTMFERAYPQFVDRIHQNQIAAYLGITPEFLSKIKKSLSEEK